MCGSIMTYPTLLVNASEINPVKVLITSILLASKLSESAHNRLKQAVGMTQDEFAGLLAERDRVRGVYATLNGEFDVCATLSAPGAAPKGLDWTGDPLFTVPTSLVGMPTVTLPVLADEGLPLGLQVIGHTNQDADLFANAGSILELF